MPVEAELGLASDVRCIAPERAKSWIPAFAGMTRVVLRRVGVGQGGAGTFTACFAEMYLGSVAVAAIVVARLRKRVSRVAASLGASSGHSRMPFPVIPANAGIQLLAPSIAVGCDWIKVSTWVETGRDSGDSPAAFPRGVADAAWRCRCRRESDGGRRQAALRPSDAPARIGCRRADRAGS